MSKRYLDNNEIKNFCGSIVQQIALDSWRPGCVVAPSRGGLWAGVMLSHYYNCNFIPLRFSTRDFVGPQDDVQLRKTLTESLRHQSVLVVDDINDSGQTLTKIQELYAGLDFPADDVRYAVLLEKSSSCASADYVGQEVYDDQEWIVFPYEEWWMR